MPVELFSNLPATTVSSGGTTAPPAGTTETWTVTSSSGFPAASSTASPPTQFHVADQAAGKTTEIIAVTNVSGTTWTVTRGAESTVPVAHSSGFTVNQVVTAAGLSGFLQSANNLSDVASGPAAYNHLSPMTTLGDIEYESGANTAARLAGNTAATKNFLTQTGTGTVSAPPAWGTIAAADVPTLNQNTTGNAATATNLAGGATLLAYLAPAVVALVDGATISVNAALGNVFTVTLGGSRTLANPTNPVAGQTIHIHVTQDATGSRTLSYGTAYDFGTAGTPTLTTTAGKMDILGFTYDANLAKWCYLGSGLGF